MVSPLIPGSPAHRAAGLTAILHATRVVAGLDADPQALITYAQALAALGVHVAIIPPGSKVPGDYRTADQKTADGPAARGGWYLATSDPRRLADYIRAAWCQHGRAPGIGMHLGPSNIVAVDADNEADAIALHRAHWSEQVAAGVKPTDVRGPLTVRTPGKQLPDGSWAHRDGAHGYFTIPEGMAVRATSEAAALDPAENRAGWDLKAGMGAGVVLPPTQRAEGRYRAFHGVQVIPTWLAELAAPKAAPAPRSRTADDVEFDQAVDEAMDDVDWADLIDGVAVEGEPDRDGCRVFTRPGGQARSIVCHDGCEAAHGSTVATIHSDTIIDTFPLLAELHQRRGSKNFTKWELAAAFQCDGSMRAAAERYGFARPLTTDWSGVFAIPSTNGAPAVGTRAMPLATVQLKQVMEGKL